MQKKSECAQMLNVGIRNSGFSLDASTFRNPPMDCRPTPFWSFNGKLQKNETRWQVREMADKGMGGGFMHSRPGLSTPYLGEKWFANISAAIDEGARTGFLPWLYDEDRWPSGCCGGETAAVNPDFRQRCLVAQYGETPVPALGTIFNGSAPNGRERLLGRFRIVREADGKYQFVHLDTDTTGPDDIAFYDLEFPCSGWKNGGYAADLLHSGAVKEFIRNTYEVYKTRVEQHFGARIPGVFTDEPTLRGSLPWSATFAEEFLERRGYDLLQKLPHLFFETDSAPGVRHDYWKTVHELFNENLMKQLGNWCEKNNLALTGHLNKEHYLWSQIQSCGGVMLHYAQMDIPGIDILREDIGEVITCKQAAGICNQLDKTVMLSELYGSSGYDFSFEGQKWIGDWQMALGVNFLCPHLSWYSMEGCAKRDHPPNFLYQSPWWRHYKKVADYQSRLCYALRRGRPVRDVLLLHPLTGGWCKIRAEGDEEDGFGIREMDAQFKQIMSNLLRIHFDYDLGDEMIMAEHGSVEGKELVVGQARYKLVIIPRTCNLETATIELLEQFADCGGQILWLGDPAEYVDGQPSERPRQLMRSASGFPVAADSNHLEQHLDSLLERRVSIIDANTKQKAADVVYQLRKLDNGYLLFLANTDRMKGIEIKVGTIEKGYWELWNCETGEVSAMPAPAGKDDRALELNLPPAGSALLRQRTDTAPHPLPSSVQKTRNETVLNSSREWRFNRLAPNSLVLDRCSWRLNDESFSKPMFLSHAQDIWRKRLGLGPVHAVNVDTQLWKLREDLNNMQPLARLDLTYSFHLREMPKGNVHLALENHEAYEIRVNGSIVTDSSDGWFIDKAIHTLPVRPLLKKGENLIELRSDLCRIRTVEDIYLTGDFGVDPKDFSLISEPRHLATGDWCAQGYPFYTDGIMYETQFTIEAPIPSRVLLELERFEGTVAAVHVNGMKAAILGWRPYSADITAYVHAGTNDLGVEIVGSLRNLMGPRHSRKRYPAWVGSREFLETTVDDYHIISAGLTGNVKLVLIS